MRFFMRFLYGVTAAVLVLGAGDRTVLAVNSMENELHDASKIHNYSTRKFNDNIKAVPVDGNGNIINDYYIHMFKNVKINPITEAGASGARFYSFDGVTDPTETKTFYAEKIEPAAMNAMEINTVIHEQSDLYEILKNIAKNYEEMFIGDIRNLVGDQNCLKNPVQLIPKNETSLRQQLGTQEFTLHGTRLLWIGLFTDKNNVYKAFNLVEYFPEKEVQDSGAK